MGKTISAPKADKKTKATQKPAEKKIVEQKVPQPGEDDILVINGKIMPAGAMPLANIYDQIWYDAEGRLFHIDDYKAGGIYWLTSAEM